MSARSESFVNLLDLLAFFLVVPEVFGAQRLVNWFNKVEKSWWWVRSIWFGRDTYPFNPANSIIACAVALAVPLSLFGVIIPGSLLSAIFILTFAIPGLFVVIYGAIAQLSRPLGLIRSLAIIGSLMFVVARAIVLANSWVRF